MDTLTLKLILNSSFSDANLIKSISITISGSIYFDTRSFYLAFTKLNLIMWHMYKY